MTKLWKKLPTYRVNVKLESELRELQKKEKKAKWHQTKCKKEQILSPGSSDSETSAVPVSPYSTDYSSPSPTLTASSSGSTDTGSNHNLDTPSPCGSEAVTSALCHSETPLQEESSGPTSSSLMCSESIDLTKRDSESTITISTDSDNGGDADGHPF